MDLEVLRQRLEAFASDREWDQFHSTRNLLLALVGEVGELSELLQWVGDDGVHEFLSSGGRERLGEELADVLIYVVRLADKSGVHLNAAIEAKLKSNAAKYPIERSKGSAKKYNET
jgi:dCTP diphosphatase